MPALGELIAGCSLAIAIGSGLACAAQRCSVRWGSRASAAERVSDWLLTWTSLAVALVQVLGFAGLLRLWIVALAAVGCGVIALQPPAAAAERLGGLVRDLRAGGRVVAHSPSLMAAALLGALLAIRGLRLPELSWDGLTYHLTYPAAWLQAGAFVRFEAGGVWEQYESFPKAGEALFLLALLPFHADHFVHWVNLPLWLGIGCTLRAALLRLGAARRAADLATCLALGCPALSAYVTPAYVEVPMTFALCAALAAAARVLAARDVAALAPFWLALSLAGAIKITALAYLPLGVLVTMLAMRATSPRACLRPAAFGCVLGAVVLAPWYLHNVVQCQNPLYPSALPGALDGPAAGSLANVWAVRETSVLSQAAVPGVIDALARPPWRVRYPLGPGWMALLALPASVLSSVALWLRYPRAPQARAAIVLSLLAIGLCFVYAISPWNGVFREANTRFLMPSLVAAIASLALGASLAPRWIGRVVAALGCALLATSLATARFVRDAWQFGPATWAVLALLATGLAGSVALSSPVKTRRRWLAATALGAGLCLWTLGAAIDVRGAHRFDAYVRDFDLHPVAMSPALWQRVDALPPSRIAFAVGDVNATEGWFFYPLFGSRLQHTVQYIDIESTAPFACVRRGLIRDQPDELAWRTRLREQRVDYLVIAGEPIERTWVRSRLAAFQPVFQEANSVLLRINPPALVTPPAPFAGTR